MSERFLPAGTNHASQAYEMLSDLWMGRLNGAEWKVLYYTARRTVGFGKPTDRISLGQFQHGIKTRQGCQLDIGTGLSRDAVWKALTSLADKGLLIVEKGRPNEPNLYGLNWDLITDSQKLTSQENGLPGSQKNGLGVVRKTDPQLSVSTLSITTDFDYVTTNHKKRDSSSRVGVCQSESKVYPNLTKVLALYMNLEPTSGQVAGVMDAAGGATEGEVAQYLIGLHDERKLRPGTKNGPRTFAWFPAVVADHFGQASANGATGRGLRLEPECFDRMTASIELPDAV